MNNKKDLIETTLKKKKADLVLKNARIPSIYTGRMIHGDVAIFQDRIAGIGEYEGKTEIDLHNALVLPGLLDAHFHIESSMSTPSALSGVLLRHGVTTVIADPHEIVNAAGKQGLEFMLEDARLADVDYFFMLPSSVPSCDFEVNGQGEYTAEDMKPVLDNDRVLGLGEVMRMLDVLDVDERMFDKLALFEDRIIDGHCPGLSATELQAYKAAGIDTDHEASSIEEALERLEAGFQLLIRQGSGARNLEDLLSGLLQEKTSLAHCSFCTDDKHLEDMEEEGTIDQDIVLAQRVGADFIDALRMATINTADCYGFKDRGAVIPGALADLVIVQDPALMDIQAVLKNGQFVYTRPDSVLEDLPEVKTKEMACLTSLSDSLKNSVHLPALSQEDLSSALNREDGVELIPDQLLTRLIHEDPRLKECPDASCNVLFSGERYGKSGEYALCPVLGYNLHDGAVAMSYAHDSHNVIAISDSIASLHLALEKLQEIQGGIVVVSNGKVFDALPMEAAGLMSLLPAREIADKIRNMKQQVRKMGVPKGVDPFATLSFLSLPVIPEVRLTPQGLYDTQSKTFLHPGRTA